MCDKKRNANRILWERLDHGRTIVECIEKKLRGVTVGQPVTRLPPHRSQRAELPHWALQKYSLL